MKKQISKSSISNMDSLTPETEGVKTLLGEPKKAIIKLGLPMAAAMSLYAIYNIADGIWVSGLGADALSAVGFFFPFFFLIMAISMGLGFGAASAIARKIGARDKAGADAVAVHTIIIMLMMTVVYTIPLYLFAEKIFLRLGAGPIIGLTLSYARIMFAGTPITFFTYIAINILRGEGDAKKATFAMALGSVLNIGLDPLFIYTLGLGVAGAAWATILSLLISSILLFFWLFVKKNTYISFNFRGFRFKREIVGDIFKVGVPAMVQELSMAFTMLIMNLILVRVGGTDGVAVYTTGWRVVIFALLPCFGIASAVISVSGAAFGQREFKKLNTAFMYALKVGIIIELLMAVLTVLFSTQIAALFTRVEGSARIADDLVMFLRIVWLFYPVAVIGGFSDGVFQGIGKGMNALVSIVTRTVILMPLFSMLFALFLDQRHPGLWAGIVVGNIVGSIVVFLWVKTYVRKLIETEEREIEVNNRPLAVISEFQT